MKVCLGEVSEQRQELFEALFPFGGSFTKSFILSTALSLHHPPFPFVNFCLLCHCSVVFTFLFSFFGRGLFSLMCLLQFSDVKSVLSQHFAQPTIPKIIQKSFFLLAYHQQQSPMHGFIGLTL
jgi:hypothetical protein